LPIHGHERAYFSLLRRGGYGERYGPTEVRYRPRTVHFHPPGIVHQDEIAPGGASFLIVEIADPLLRRVTVETGPAQSCQDLRGGELSQTALRLAREYEDPARRSPLVMEGLVLELLAIAGRLARRAETGEPPWLRRVIDRLHAELDRRLTLEDLAREEDVHPVRLARVFRKRMGCSVGEYVQELRVRWIEERLGHGDLAQLAVEAGFVDQSHMTRVFRRLTGRTPGSVRQERRAAPRGR
jgi:AraC family transcriptional regulator